MGIGLMKDKEVYIIYIKSVDFQIVIDYFRGTFHDKIEDFPSFHIHEIIQVIGVFVAGRAGTSIAND